jgi:uncharacterized protein
MIKNNNFRNIEDTNFMSLKVGELPKGCKYCVKGQKLVLFVTGLCPRSCFYCPLSEHKMKKDVIYANERPIKDDTEILIEAKGMDAKGAGITGGDPLIVIDRTIHYIKLLKKEFGNHFHIHLYTSSNLSDKDKFKKLYEAGLDEIRFHLDIEKKEEWNILKEAKEFSWDVGVEIPIFPDKKFETIEMIKIIKDDINFLNLNELEISEINADSFYDKDYEVKEEFSYGILGSEKTAIEIMEYCKQYSFQIHYCTTHLKDGVQLTERIKRMAKYNAKPFDKITQEGLFIRGAIYLDGIEPGFDYKERLALSDRRKSLKKLEELKKEIQKKFKIQDKFIDIDEKKLRIITRASLMKNIAKKIKEPCGIVEEYPTYDQTEIEIEMLNRNICNDSDEEQEEEYDEDRDYYL